MIEGIDQADSFVFNPHKWMFTNFDCSVYYVKDAPLLIKTFEVLPEYLKTKSRGMVNDYRDWSVPLGRRFRALKLWFVIRSYGVEGIREKLREHVKMNKYFCEALGSVNGIIVPLEPFLNFSCFRLQPDGVTDPEALNRLNEAFLEEINSSGTLFLTHTKVDGIYTIRMVIGQTYVNQEHVELALERIKESARLMMLNFKALG
jgi:aromatic-L-amino-acid decarboxylase